MANRLFGRCTTAIITSFTIFSIFWIIFLVAPHVNRPRLPQFQVDSFFISNFTATPKVSFAADVRLTARNAGDKQALTSTAVTAGVYYRSSSLGVTMLPSFSLGKKGQVPLNASFPALAGNFTEWDRSVGFDLKMSFSAAFKKNGWWWPSSEVPVEVFCADLSSPIPRNNAAGGRPGGGFVGGPRPCRSRSR